MSRIIGIDPGHSTGWAIIEIMDKKMTPINCGVMNPFSVSEMNGLIAQVDIVVIENFRPREKETARGAFIGRENTTSEYIGKIETIAELLGKRCVRQEPSVKPVGYGWTNQTYRPGKKGTHFQDALAHAGYYAVQKLGASPVKSKKP